MDELTPNLAVVYSKSIYAILPVGTASPWKGCGLLNHEPIPRKLNDNLEQQQRQDISFYVRSNPDLESVGLKNLKFIILDRDNQVFNITENPKLCDMHNINWSPIVSRLFESKSINIQKSRFQQDLGRTRNQYHNINHNSNCQVETMDKFECHSDCRWNVCRWDPDPYDDVDNDSVFCWKADNEKYCQYDNHYLIHNGTEIKDDFLCNTDKFGKRIFHVETNDTQVKTNDGSSICPYECQYGCRNYTYEYKCREKSGESGTKRKTVTLCQGCKDDFFFQNPAFDEHSDCSQIDKYLENYTGCVRSCEETLVKVASGTGIIKTDHNSNYNEVPICLNAEVYQHMTDTLRDVI